MTTSASDAALHHDQWATVTRSSILINGTTYAPASIASVSVRGVRSATGVQLIFALGSLIACFGLQFTSCAYCVDIARGNHEGVLIGAATIVGGIVVARWGPLVLPVRHTIFLGVGGQEVAAIYSPDPTWAGRVANAIATAIGAPAPIVEPMVLPSAHVEPPPQAPGLPPAAPEPAQIYSPKASIVWTVAVVACLLALMAYGVLRDVPPVARPVASAAPALPPTPPPTETAPVAAPAAFDAAECKRKRARDLAENKTIISELRAIEKAAATVERYESDCFDRSLPHMRAVDALKTRHSPIPDTMVRGFLASAIGNIRACSLACGAQAQKAWDGQRCREAAWHFEQMDTFMATMLADKHACEP